MTNEAQPDYLAYLLRLWRMSAAANTWRASLQEPHTGEQRAFADPEAAFDFLRAEMGLVPPGPIRPVEATEEVENKT